MRKSRILLSVALFLILCGSISAKVTLKSYTRMDVDQRYDSLSTSEMASTMQHFQQQLEAVVSRQIGTSMQYMESKAPESLLSNFLSDQLLAKAAEFSPEGVDMAVINFGGIRAPLPKGVITVGDIYKIMPFENELVILELKASDMRTILERIAKEGGEGVSNVKMEVTDGRITKLEIQGKPLDENRTYRVATIDYLADGNSGMTAFKHAIKRMNTHLKLRDAYIAQIEKLTAQGKTISSELDGRICCITNP